MSLSNIAEVSERHLANLEYGEGNPSLLVLIQIANALQCSLAELIGDFTTRSTEWLLIRELLENRDDDTLLRARILIGKALGVGATSAGTVSPKIALIGLRGAGKSTLGAMLAKEVGFPFVELGRQIKALAGCSIAEIHALYGINAYRRYERRALEETIQLYPEAIIATPGGIVSDSGSLNLLLTHCTAIWLQATPADHMQRVMEQGDFRPMKGSKEAMEDLKGILESRKAFYSKANFTIDTSRDSLEKTFAVLHAILRKALDVA